MSRLFPFQLFPFLMLGYLMSPIHAKEPSLDQYGGIRQISGQPGDSFHLEKVGRRWWLMTPEGHGMFIRAVSKVDTSDYGGSGGFRAYDGVYLQTASGKMSPNLQAAAQSSHPRDTVHPATGVTLKAKGDVLYLGSSRFQPNFSYFWLDQLGKGGQVKWYYSTRESWKLIRGTGSPFRGEALSQGGGWHLDTGNYMAPDENGFGQWGNRQANKITWWDMKEGFPAYFAQVSLPDDPTPRYYLKGVVTQDFMEPPILNQTYERADLGEGIARKYGPGDYFGKWAQAMTQRLRSWGFNAAGQYSYAYVEKAARQTDRLPVEPTWALGGWVTRKDRPYHVKNVYAGAVFPPGSKNLLYQGLQPDVFEPGFEKGYVEMVQKEASAKGPWCWALIPEDADYLFGLNSLTHDHMGYVVLSQNPYQARAQREGKEIIYQAPKLYAKYALRDFLRDRYRAEGDRLPVFNSTAPAPAYSFARQPAGEELAALKRLNAAWGTGYTTWDTASGDLVKGSNAWGTGTGFMDENGKAILAPQVRSVGFNQQFTRREHPAIRKDLDDFIAAFASRYGKVLQQAFARVPHPVLLLPVYNGPDFVYRSLAPYVDGFWVSIPEVKDALRIYNASHKPLVVADYLSSDPDSPCFFQAKITAIRHDPARGTTTLATEDLRYKWRLAQTLAFPDCPALLEIYKRLGRPYPFPRVKAAWWDRVEVPGDYTAFLKPGMHLEMWKYGKYPYPRRSQKDRARDMIRHYESLLSLRGDDGMEFVIGLEHWCLYDPAESNWVDSENFGLATFQDNAYDGVEARRQVGRDERGYPIGGEEADYGNLLGDLSAFFKTIPQRLGGRP